MSERKALTMSAGEFLQPISKPVTEPEISERFIPMVQGTATNRLRLASTKDIRIDRNGNAIIEEEGFKAFMEGYAGLKSGLNTGAKKLLDAGAIELTKNNHYRPREGQPLETGVFIPLEEYGSKRGYDLTPRQTETPEEAEAERKRLSNVMHEIRKRANAELSVLFSLYLSWTEPGKKKDPDFDRVRVVQRTSIRNGKIFMRFSEDMAAYLMHAYQMQYPLALQRIDERNPRAYNLGFSLSLHHSMDSNRAKGTADILSVKTLLKDCDLPTFEEVQASKDRGHWERRIKDPLEAALDSNVATGVIQGWEYCNSKGVALEEGQVSIADYSTFIGLYVRFIMEGEPDQSERLQRKAERKEAAKSKRPRKKAASKKE